MIEMDLIVQDVKILKRFDTIAREMPNMRTSHHAIHQVARRMIGGIKRWKAENRNGELEVDEIPGIQDIVRRNAKRSGKRNDRFASLNTDAIHARGTGLAETGSLRFVAALANTSEISQQTEAIEKYYTRTVERVWA